MAPFSKYVNWNTREEKSVQLESYTVTPISQTLNVQIPHFQFTWKRPAAVKVNDGVTTERIRIIDWTRVFQVGTLALSFIVVSLYWITGRK